MRTPKRRKRPQPKQTRWFIVRRGFVQNYVSTADGTRRVSMPLFSDRATCVEFINHYMATGTRPDGDDGAPRRPAEIGTVEGETLASVLATSPADEALWIEDVRPNGFLFRAMPLGEANA
jgi:hypothetical protein